MLLRSGLNQRILLMCLAGALSPWSVASAQTAYVTNQGSGVSVVDLQTLKVTGSIEVGKDPRGIAISPDGRRLVVATQGNGDVSIVDIGQGGAPRRVPVGKNPEFVRIGPDGRFAYVTYEPSSTGKPPGEAAKKGGEEAGDGKGGGKGGKDDDDKQAAEIAVIDLDRGEIVRRLPASLETEGMDFTADGQRLVVANEGDDTVVVYDLASGAAIRKVDISKDGSRPRGVKTSPDGKSYVVTLESSDAFLVLDSDFKVVKTVPTGQGPYGVSFDPSGSQLWVAAARSGQLRVYDAATLAPVGSVAVGKRCWHFSFTPDGARVLAACGRSDALSVVDAKTLKPLQALEGFKQPWGIVTWPKASGSLDTATR